MENTTVGKKIAILGIGQAGIRIVDVLNNVKQANNFAILAIDSDKSTLEESSLAEDSKLLVGSQWRNGNGCGGNISISNRIFGHSRAIIEEKLKGFDMVISVCGLGRGTGSGSITILNSIMKKLKIQSIFVVTLPFAMEGPMKIRLAENLLKNEIHNYADAVITLPNDLLFSSLASDVSFEEALLLSNKEVSKVIISLALVFSCGNIMPANYADLLEAIGRKKHYASIGLGTVSSNDLAEERLNLLLERMLKSPLLGGIDKIEHADLVIISLIGGVELSVADTKYILEKSSSFVNEKANIITNVSTKEDFGNSLLLSIIAINFDTISQEEDFILNYKSGSAVQHKKRKIDSTPIQQQFDFESDLNARGIMEKTTPVFYKGEDLDIPSFTRKQIKINSLEL